MILFLKCGHCSSIRPRSMMKLAQRSCWKQWWRLCERVRSSTVISQRTFLGSYSFNFDSYSFNFDFVKSRLSKERRVYCRLLD